MEDLMERGSLILTRKVEERIMIGENAEIIITLMGIKGNQARIRVQVDRSVPILREEIYNRVKLEGEVR